MVNTLSRLNNALYSKIIHKLSIYDRYVRSLKSTVICAEVPLMAESRRDKLLWNTEVSKRKMFIPLTVAVDIKWQIFDAILCRIIGLHYLHVKIMITKVNCYIEKGMTCSQWLFTMYGVKTKLIQKHRHWLLLPDLFWGEVDIHSVAEHLLQFSLHGLLNFSLNPVLNNNFHSPLVYSHLALKHMF